jgi:hypothetical protein
MEHIPCEWPPKRNEMRPVAAEVRNSLLKDARTIWRTILANNGRIKFDHTCSMKAFQLDQPDLQEWGGEHQVSGTRSTRNIKCVCIRIFFISLISV